MIQGQLLFPTHILHALNAIQYLRARHIMADCVDEEAFSTCEEIADAIGAPKDTLWRALMALTRARIVAAKKGSGGGYYMSAAVLHKTRVREVIAALGKQLPDNGDTRASDKLNNTVSDCLDMTLDEFLKA